MKNDIGELGVEVPELLKCILCEELLEEIDMQQVRGKAICIWCLDEIVQRIIRYVTFSASIKKKTKKE